MWRVHILVSKMSRALLYVVHLRLPDSQNEEPSAVIVIQERDS